jgi:transcriptional regulator with XRE-family HTH domain
VGEGDSSPQKVGAALADLRRRRGLTGRKLGALVGMSQAKISKIESGATTPKSSDVMALARALDAPAALIRQLIDWAEAEQDRFGLWRDVGIVAARGQQEVAALERDATEIRGLNVTVPSGLLHTASYAGALLAEYTRPLLGEDQGPESAQVLADVTERVRRQEILADSSKLFLFLMAETALLNQVATAAIMLGQVERIREAARQDNVIVRILPFATRLAYPPMHDFELLDERAAIIDTMTTTIVTRENSELRVYGRVYESLYRQATPDIEPILNRYARRYAELAGKDASGPGVPVAADLIGRPDSEEAD